MTWGLSSKSFAIGECLAKELSDVDKIQRQPAGGRLTVREHIDTIGGYR